MNEREIELLEIQLQRLKNIRRIQSGYFSSSGVNGWISSTISILEQKFGKKSLKIRELANLKDSMIVSLSGDSCYEEKVVIDIAEPILQSCIELLEVKELTNNNNNNKGKTDALNLTFIQQQSNLQTINLEVITKVLQNELDTNQLKEIKCILDSVDSKENKKIKLVEKLKGFGIDILSNVISGLLTNTLQ